MKRTPFLRQAHHKGFKPRTKPMKRSGIKKRATVKNGPNRKRIEACNLPDWLRSIPYGSHGSSPAQKRAWKYMSDMVRKDDFDTYGGKCVSCPRRLENWKEGDCGHYIAWSNCNAIFKFYRKNLALQCKHCNNNGGMSIGYEFGEELKRRYGPDILTELAYDNATHHGDKLYDADVVALVSYFHDIYPKEEIQSES